MSAKTRSNTRANLVSLFQGGSFFGAGMQLPFTEKYGRKWSVIFANILFIASAFAQTFAAGSVGIFMFGRFLGGFSVGFLSLVIRESAHLLIPIFLLILASHSRLPC